MSPAEVSQSIQNAPLFAAIRESALAYPVILALHLSSIALFGGAILMSNLRLLGLAMTAQPAMEVVAQLRNWKRFGLVAMVGTGILLAGAKAETYYANPYFQIKLGLLVLAGVHAAVFHGGVYGRTAKFSDASRMAKAAACLSLVLWLGIVAAGRLIAYYEPGTMERPVKAIPRRMVTMPFMKLSIVRAVCACAGLVVFGAPGSFAQKRTVAITVDDLPYASGGLVSKDGAEESSQAGMVNRRLLAAFRARHIPVTGFVIQKRVESLGPAGPKILKEWAREGFDLGNHTYSHADANDLSIEQIQEEIVRGELTIGPLMKEAGKKLEFFRFPMNHSGDTKAKHDAIAEFLLRRGYRLATCTIDTSDYLFNQAYVRMVADHDSASAQRLRRDYLAYTDAEIDYYAGLNRQVFGYAPPQVMLLHDNRLNADVIEQILKIFSEKAYAFVDLAAAQSDDAYRTSDTYVTKFGPMWGYRWANERKVKVDGRLEPAPPKWISEYGKP